MIAVIWNGRAGRATPELLAAIRASGATIFDGDEHDLVARVAAARAAGARVIVAAGGDGTVSEVAAELVGGDVALGVLPMGTSNSFAAALGIPDDLDAARELLATADRRLLDVGVVTGGGRRKIMVLHCMVGFHAETIVETSTESKRRWGVLAYAMSAVRKLASLSPFRVELDTGDEVIRTRAIAVGVANLAPAKSVLAHGPSHLLGDDGKLDVTIVAAESMTEAIATGVHLYRQARDGEPATRDNVGSFAATRLVITTEPTQHVLIDGEPFGDTPVTIEVVPRALQVVAPPGDTAEPPIDSPLEGLPDLEIAPA